MLILCNCLKNAADQIQCTLVFSFRYDSLVTETNTTKGKLLSETNRDLDLQKRIDDLEKSRKESIASFSQLQKDNNDEIASLQKQVRIMIYLLVHF